MTAQVNKRRVFAPIRAAIVATTFVSGTMAAGAGEVADKAAEAETLLQSGQAVAGFTALDDAVDAFWIAAPLVIQRSYLAAGGENGKALDPQSGPTITAADRVAVHIEPLGYGFDEDDGNFRISLTTAIEIQTPGGLILAKSSDFGRLEWSGAVKNRSFSGQINIDMPDLKPGSYELHLTLSDDASKKTAKATLPFDIAPE